MSQTQFDIDTHFKQLGKANSGLYIFVQLPDPKIKFLNVTKNHAISAGPLATVMFGYGGPYFDSTAPEDTGVGACEEDRLRSA